MADIDIDLNSTLDNMAAAAAPLRWFHPVIKAEKLRGGPVAATVGGTRYALFRDGEGKVGALVDRCPHRMAPLSAGTVRDGRLACPYHGWNFDRAGNGRSPHQPELARCDAQAVQATERFGYVWLGNDEADPAAIDAMDWPEFDFAGGITVPFDAPLHVVLDNFSEDEHTPFVHTRLGWSLDRALDVEFTAENHDDRSEVYYQAPQRKNILSMPLGLRPGDTFHNSWTTRFDPVRTLYTLWFTRGSEDRVGVTLRYNIYMVPETATRTQMHVFCFVQYHAAHLVAMKSVLGPLVVFLTRREILDDARFIPKVAHTPLSMRGMRLGRFDKPIIHNRKLLKRLYWGGVDEVPLLDAAPVELPSRRKAAIDAARSRLKART